MRRTAAENQVVLIRWAARMVVLLSAATVIASVYIALHFVVKYW